MTNRIGSVHGGHEFEPIPGPDPTNFLAYYAGMDQMEKQQWSFGRFNWINFTPKYFIGSAPVSSSFF